MALSLQATRGLTELMRSEPSVVGFSEDLYEGGTLRVYVEDMAYTDVLPARIAGQVVQYEEVGVPQKIAQMQSPAAVDVDPRTQVRPIVGGISIAPAAASYSGTLGYFVVRDERVGVLTCAHVLPDSSDKRVIQQSAEDGGDSGEVVATLAAPIDDRLSVDCAFAMIDRAIKHERNVNAIGRVSRSRMAKRDEMAQKSGRMTKVTKGGKITDVSATIKIGPDTYRDQLLVETTSKFAAGGDSGSLLIAESDTAAVGLVMATNVPHGTRTWANQIGLVEEALSVKLA